MRYWTGIIQVLVSDNAVLNWYNFSEGSDHKLQWTVTAVNSDCSEHWLQWTVAAVNSDCSEQWLQWTVAAVNSGCSEQWLQWTVAAVNSRCSEQWLQWTEKAAKSGCSELGWQWSVKAVSCEGIEVTSSGTNGQIVRDHTHNNSGSWWDRRSHTQQQWQLGRS